MNTRQITAKVPREQVPVNVNKNCLACENSKASMLFIWVSATHTHTDLLYVWRIKSLTNLLWRLAHLKSICFVVFFVCSVCVCCLMDGPGELGVDDFGMNQ